MKKTLKLFFTLILTGIIVSCSTFQLLNSTGCSSFGDKLREIEGVSSVTEIQQNSPIFKEKYIVTFSQPIDWNDFSKGTFEQRVEIGFQGYENVSNYSVNGYCLNDIILESDNCFAVDDRDELCVAYDCNLINIEYRFFGKSVPYGLSNDEIILWDNLTVENAAKDLYSITEKLSTVLTGKRIISGHSKGGFTVNTMSLYYPDSFDAFISYVAPLCNGTEDSRMVNAVYNPTDNGGTSFAIKTEMKEQMLEFEVFCIANRAELEDMYYRIAQDSGCKFRNSMTKEILWDLSVLDFSLAYWQYGGDFNQLQEILQMPDSNEVEHKKKMEETVNTVNYWAPADYWSTNSFVFPYFWQSFKEMGQYSYDFSFLRDSVISATGEDMLVVKKDMETDIVKRLLFTEEQQKILEYDNSIYKALLDWSQTTDSNLIMIFGEFDPWYAVRIPQTDNDNIHVYCIEKGCHSVFISDLNEEDFSECKELLNNWLL